MERPYTIAPPFVMKLILDGGFNHFEQYLAGLGKNIPTMGFINKTPKLRGESYTTITHLYIYMYIYII